MDNAVAQPKNASLAQLSGTTLLPAPAGFAARVQALPVRTQAMAALGVVGLLVVLALMFSGARTSDYQIGRAHV